MVMASTSAMDRPLYCISRLSLLYRFPPHSSQVTYTSGRKCISILNRPSPLHASQRPPLTLKLNRPGPYPRTRLWGSLENTSRIRENAPVYVAGLLRGVRPIGDWSITIALSISSIPLIVLCWPGRSFEWYSFRKSARRRIVSTSVLFPLPDTPVTQMKRPRGNFTVRSARLFSAAPRTSSQPDSGRWRDEGTAIPARPVRYRAVSDRGLASRSSTEPWQTISPPWMPAPGPRSTT